MAISVILKDGPLKSGWNHRGDHSEARMKKIQLRSTNCWGGGKEELGN
jgi:hypothetical protein